MLKSGIIWDFNWFLMLGERIVGHSGMQSKSKLIKASMHIKLHE